MSTNRIGMSFIPPAAMSKCTSVDPEKVLLMIHPSQDMKKKKLEREIMLQVQIN